MSTSLLYYGFGITGYNYRSTTYSEGNLTFTISRKEFNLRSPICKSKKVIKPLMTTYYMKEDLRQLWNWPGDKSVAE